MSSSLQSILDVIIIILLSKSIFSCLFAKKEEEHYKVELFPFYFPIMTRPSLCKVWIAMETRRLGYRGLTKNLT